MSDLPPTPGELRRIAISAGQKAGLVRNCQQCGTDLTPDSPEEPLGTFMLHDFLWNIASLDGKIDCLCLACTEQVLGTRLPSSAFNADQMVPEFLLTAELRDRLNPETDGGSAFNLDLDSERAAIASREFTSLRSREAP